MRRLPFPEGWLSVPLVAAIAAATSAGLGAATGRESGQVLGVSGGVVVGAAGGQALRVLFRKKPSDPR